MTTTTESCETHSVKHTKSRSFTFVSLSFCKYFQTNHWWFIYSFCYSESVCLSLGSGRGQNKQNKYTYR